MAEGTNQDGARGGLFGPDPLAGLPVGDYRRSRARRRGAASPRLGLNLTAMIDVVFLLLIYFMVGTRFKLGEEIYRTDLPPRGGEAQRDPFELDEEPLRIHIASTGRAGRSYHLRIEGPYRQSATFEELGEFLEERQINEYSVGGLFAPDHPIIIEPTRRTRWEHAIGAFNAAARARFTNITFSRPD